MRRFAVALVTTAALLGGLTSQAQASSEKDYSQTTKTDLTTKIIGNNTYSVYSSMKLVKVQKKGQDEAKG